MSEHIIARPLENTNSALALVSDERIRQIDKWGMQDGNTLPEWVSILGEEYGELCQAINETVFKTKHSKPELGGLDAIEKEAVQVAAVAVAIVEAIRKEKNI